MSAPRSESPILLNADNALRSSRRVSFTSLEGIAIGEGMSIDESGASSPFSAEVQSPHKLLRDVSCQTSPVTISDADPSAFVSFNACDSHQDSDLRSDNEVAAGLSTAVSPQEQLFSATSLAPPMSLPPSPSSPLEVVLPPSRNQTETVIGVAEGVVALIPVTTSLSRRHADDWGASRAMRCCAIALREIAHGKSKARPNGLRKAMLHVVTTWRSELEQEAAISAALMAITLPQ